MSEFPAIVLSCDRYRAIAEHMILAYREKWPDHPFRFRLPFQQLGQTGLDEPIELVQTPLPIRATVLGLLEGLADEEWMYWCIDDKYPIHLDLAAHRGTAEWLQDAGDAPVDGVMNCRSRRMWDPRCLSGPVVHDPVGRAYLERNSYDQIWIHQFLKVKVLRLFFQSLPEHVPSPHELDDHKDRLQKPVEHRLYVARRNGAIFGESAVQGVLTANCRNAMQARGLDLPDWGGAVTSGLHLIGDARTNLKQRARYAMGRLTGRLPDGHY